MKFKRTAMALLLSSLTAGVAFAQGAPASSASGAQFSPENPPQPSDCEKMTDNVQRLACATLVSLNGLVEWSVQGFDTKADKTEVEKLKENTIEALRQLATAADEDNGKLDAKIDAVDNKLSNKADKSALENVDRKAADASDSAVKAEKASEDNAKSISELEGKVEKKLNTSEFEEFKGKLKDAALKTAEKIDEMFNEKADKSDLEALAAYTNLAVDVVNQHSEAILQQGEDFTKFKAQVEEGGKTVAEALETLRERSNEHSQAIEAQGEDIEKLKETANNHVDAINALAHDYRTVTTNHANVLKNLAEDKADKAEVKEANDLAVAALKSLAAVEDAIDVNVEAIAENAKAIEANKTAAANATAAAAAASEEAKVAKRAADSVESTATSAKTEATAAKSVADNAREIATTAEGKADTNAGKITTLEGGYATLVTTTNTLNTQVRDLDARVKANTDRINQLDLRVENVQKEMRRGLAAQAALSGLFQPYTVGKANITAAVGGYKSQTALAVGAGYRFNAKFAAKAGLALNTSGRGMAYNVAVNYEF